jgi:hypothetical protein
LKVPCFVDAQPEKWFGLNTSVETLNLLISRLGGVLLHTRSSYLGDLRRLAGSHTLLSPFYEKLLTQHLILTQREPNQDFYIFRDSQTGDGALLRGWTSQEMKLKEISYQSAKYPNSNEATTLDDSIRFHNRNARDITLIDPYFGAQLCQEDSPLVALGEFFRSDVREIRIFTRLPKGETWDVKKWGEWKGKGGETVATISNDELDRISRSRKAFEEQFLWRLQRQLERTTSLVIQKKVSVSVHDPKTFPHDRHLAFSFPSCDESGKTISAAVKDYFSLGNGLTTLGYLGRYSRVSHVYHSDTERMWTGFGAYEIECSRVAELKKEAQQNDWIQVQ